MMLKYVPDQMQQQIQGTIKNRNRENQHPMNASHTESTSDRNNNNIKSENYLTSKEIQ